MKNAPKCSFCGKEAFYYSTVNLDLIACEEHKNNLTKEERTSFKFVAPKDPINPPHYKQHPSGIECIQVTQHFNFNLGNVIKYIWRAGEKRKERS